MQALLLATVLVSTLLHSFFSGLREALWDRQNTACWPLASRKGAVLQSLSIASEFIHFEPAACRAFLSLILLLLVVMAALVVVVAVAVCVK